MVTLTFATTCFNRLHQLKQVYYDNLVTYENNPHVDFILVNFHGKDSEEIDIFVFERCIRFLVTKKLKYFKRISKMTEFHMSRCKNVSHLLSTGELIYNLDGDNILDGSEYDTASQAFSKFGPNFLLHQCDGSSPIDHKMFQYFNLFPKYHDRNLMFNGTCGRVCTSRTVFKKIGGYNERFEYMGMDDIDFIARSIKGTGCKYIHSPLTSTGKFLSNERPESYEHTNSKNWEKMNQQYFKGQIKNDTYLDPVEENFRSSEPSPTHRRLFDLTFTTHGFGNHHRHGWNEVRDYLVQHYEHNENGIILDLFCERTNFWNPLDCPKDYYHRKPWIGFIHTTVNSNPLYSTLYELLQHFIFLDSLKYCLGLIVLCPKNKNVLDSFFEEKDILNMWGSRIPVHVLRHPTEIFEDQSLFFQPDTFSLEKCPIYHIGWHLRDFSKFYQLDCGKNHSKYLVVPNIYPGEFVETFVHKSCKMADIDMSLESSKVEIIESLDNEEYDHLLRTSIVFNYLIEPSGSNLITECISRTNPIIVNRHESLEFYLGKDYPMFYENLEDVEKILTKENIYKAANHLKSLREKYTYEFFTESFQRIVNQMIL